MKGRKFVVTLLTVVASIGVAAPAFATSNCNDWWSNNGNYYRIRGEVRYNGAALNSVRGFAWDTWLNNAYIELGSGPYGGFVGSGMYITNANEFEAVWFGWLRSRSGAGGYGSPQLNIIYGPWNPNAGFDTDFGYFTRIPLSGPRAPIGSENLQVRLKFFNDPADGKWKFYWGYQSNGSDSQLVYTLDINPLDFPTIQLGKGYLHSGVNNTCSGARNIWNNTWRYSNTNKTWIAMGEYNTFLVRHDDNNNHYKLAGGATPKDLNVSCDFTMVSGCKYYS